MTVRELLTKNRSYRRFRQDRLLDEKTLASKGLVGYANDVESARGLDRTGENPLVVRATAANGSDLGVTDDAASLIHATVKDKKLLRRAAVVFVLD